MIPRLEDYGISPVTGFLPEEQPLKRLPEEFDCWENAAQDLPALIHTKQIRAVVDSMPVLSTLKLHSLSAKRRAYSVLGFLAHAYVWSPPNVNERIPEAIANPLLEVSEELGLPPLATFAGLCLWNFRTLPDPNLDINEWGLNNFATLTTYTGSYDESWFYVLSVALERQGGPCIDNGLKAISAAHNKDVHMVVQRLNSLENDIRELIKTLSRMPEFLDPHFFYYRLRPYLAGWKNMANEGLPNGVYYGNEKEPRMYSGGSNGQSSLIQVLDILLNVEHHALSEREPSSTLQPPKPSSTSTQRKPPQTSAFLKEMRNYMPKEHRQFLLDLEQTAIIREFVLENADKHPEVVAAYDNALMALRDFRSKHIQIVMRYISMQARKGSPEPTSSEPSKAKGMGLSQSNGQRGTGGTLLMPFLKQSRDEVSDAAAGNWGKHIVTNVYKPVN